MSAAKVQQLQPTRSYSPLQQRDQNTVPIDLGWIFACRLAETFPVRVPVIRLVGFAFGTHGRYRSYDLRGRGCLFSDAGRWSESDRPFAESRKPPKKQSYTGQGHPAKIRFGQDKHSRSGHRTLATVGLLVKRYSGLWVAGLLCEGRSKVRS